MPRLLAPSILSADFARLADEVREVEAAGADWLHVDVMDGHFVPNLTIGPLVVAALRPVTRLPLDVHLMVAQPDPLIRAFADAGADCITVHVEACPHLHRTVQSVKQAGCKAGVALNPATPAVMVTEILGDVDLVLAMTVNPGFGGQRFIPAVLPKIATLREWRDARGLTCLLEVDGGISPTTVGAAVAAGIDVVVAGSAIFGAKDRARATKDLRHAIDAVILPRAVAGA